MDYLKTQAPFWKREERTSGQRWVEARASDDEAVKTIQGVYDAGLGRLGATLKK